MLRIILFIALVATIGVAAYGQEHNHGLKGLPDWYDPSCCSKNDCKPVLDSEIEFGTNAFGNYAIYLPTGHTFYKNQFRSSQDERYHVCINPDAFLPNGALCFYDRTGA